MEPMVRIWIYGLGFQASGSGSRFYAVSGLEIWFWSVAVTTCASRFYGLGKD